jgi:FlaA1/EpsC-like NDP-sugar epimerase
VIADIRDQSRIDQIFSRYQPDIVYHAAAHKHVPLMEDNIEDAITNNIEGTRILMNLCKVHGIDHFVLISTDKAVEPSSVMGRTKRVAELIVQKAAVETGRAYVTVRFGNVLGSRGSVVPLFQHQIAEGGPVTITDPDMERFFMTIQEAVQLVLQASAMGSNGEIFVLDMGEQVKIVDLAKDLIQLSGLTVGDDIEIEFTGLRPGEKLSERLFSDQEKPIRSLHEKILIIEKDASDKYPHLDTDLDSLIQYAEGGKREEAWKLLSDLV